MREHDEWISFLEFPEGDTIKTECLVNEIQSKAKDILSQEGMYIGVRNPLIDSLHWDFHRVKVRAQAFDRIFNPPPREEDSCERNGPSISVYTGSWELRLVNGTYISVAELSSSEEAKKLAKEGKLIERIYDSEEASRVYDMKPLIEQGGYAGEIFTMRSGFKWRWTSLPNKRYGGDIRVAEDVTGIDNPHPLIDTEWIEGISFGFYDLVQELRTRVETIIGSSVSELLSPFEELSYLSYVWDVVVDQGPFFIVIKKGDTFITANKAYVAATGYTIQELEQNPRLYLASQNDQVNARLASLRNTEHYYDWFRMLRKDKTFLDASWDTFRISDKGLEPMTTVRIGSTIASAEEMKAIEEIKKLLEL